MPKRPVSKAKAKEILEHGEVRGHTLSKKQHGLFGAIAGGSPLKKYHKSPDAYNDTALGETPPRTEYHGDWPRASEGKRAGGMPKGVRAADGTENLEANAQSKAAGVTKSSPSGGGATHRPSAVDTYTDDEV